MQTSGSGLNDKLHWYKDAIIYELHIKAFCDSNGDGVGDFGGLLQKLDYLQELGVTAIWLLPFYPSPLRDDGYDIADYYAINPSYGTVFQFRQFLEEAHRRNLKVITELVINHTSDQHPWFQRARHAPKDSPERAFYVWTDDPDQYSDVRIIFQDFEGSNWTWDSVAGQYYWHRFFHHQPDLNYDNPQVQEEIFRVLDYWCEMGMDGFRLDAVPYLFEREGTNGENLPETHAFLKKLRAHIDEKFPGTVFLAEANMWPEDAASYFGEGDECHMNYHFPVMPRMYMALQREDRYPITDIFDQTPAIPASCQWAMFLRNHDELTLEMVTDEERDYMYKVYAKDPKARINLGIRHRLAPLMDNDRRKIELMNSLLFSMPGTPVIYYGDEIGMGDNFYLGDRNGVRTPMQWSPDRNAGFSAANPHSLYLPVIMDPEYSYEAVNVELQRRNTSSLFWFMKRLITLRKKYRAFGRGDLQFINADNPKVLAFTRSYADETLLVIVNLSKHAQPAELDLRGREGLVPVELFSRNRFPAVRKDQPYFFTLGAHSFQWFLLQPAVVKTDAAAGLPQLEAASLADLLEGNGPLESTILPAYLQNMKWFTGKAKSIQGISILEKTRIPLEISDAWLLLLQVQYENDLPETYCLPLTFVREPLARTIRENCAQAVVAELTIKAEQGLLCDAYYTPGLQHWLFYSLADSTVKTLGTSVIHFTAHRSLKEHMSKNGIKPRLHTDQHNNTCINYDGRFFLKLYRKVEPDLHPDLEITRYLSEDAGFAHTPPWLGSIEWMCDDGSYSLGMLQVMVENHGDGQRFMQERLHNYIERILAKDGELFMLDDYAGRITEPRSYDELSTELQALLGGQAAEHSRLFGQRVAQLHAALAAGGAQKAFAPEDFSLHYQRSLFASMQSLVREAYQSIGHRLASLPEATQLELQQLQAQREELLAELKKIYHHKLDTPKIRIHGNLHLQQILLTGKDISIHDFGGNPGRNYSERKLKRSPFRDVASMIRSFYYAAHKAFLATPQLAAETVQGLLPFASLWAHYMSGFFLLGYLQTAEGGGFLPEAREDREMLLRTFLLEGALYDLSYELNQRPGMVVVPLRLLQLILGDEKVIVQKKSPQLG